MGDYARRLRRWGTLEEETVKAEKFRGDIEAVRAAEAERLLARVGPRDRLIPLDERGEAPDSDEFLRWVEACRNDGVYRTVFAIGGAYGHAPVTRERAWRVLRVSSMVLNHELARVVLVEQLYRALARLHGAPYHH